MSEKMICPVCGAEMNFHAEKMIYSEWSRTDMERVEEIHACPRCGRTESRPEQ